MNSSRDIVKKLRENRILAERKSYENYTRDELIKMAQGGDQLAVETLINTHQDMIINYTKKYHLDTGDFDDIKQYVTIAFWEAVQKWDHTGNFEAYAGMIIKRKMADVLRSEGAEKVKISTKADKLDAPSGTDDEGGEMTLGASLPSKGLSPEEEYLGRDGAKKITEFIKNDLSETERKVILKYIEGYKVSEISEEMEMKYKTVENAIMRVKNKLADYLRNVRESRQLRLSEESIFSDEEKQILKSVISKVDNNSLNEASSEHEMDDENKLSAIESDVENLRDIIETTRDRDAYDDALDKLKDLDGEVWDILDNSEDPDIIKKAKEVQHAISVAQDTHPENLKQIDKYAEVGMSRSDFF